MLAVVAAVDEVHELFGWLCGLPFIEHRTGAWAYHEVVRAAMLRVQQAQSPSEWRSGHAILALANRRWAQEAISETGKTWVNPAWIDHTREEIYHLLCANPDKNLPEALASAARAADHSTMRAQQWAELFAEAGRDTDHPGPMPVGTAPP